MDNLRPPAPQLAELEPYDPKHLPVETVLSANENPHDVNSQIRRGILNEVKRLHFNRYPDPLANELRDLIANANGLDRGQVLIGNGGDEMLFNLSLAWGGPGRKFLNLPPTFSVYSANAKLTNTEEVTVERREDFTVDEAVVLERVSQGDIDYVIVASPNNPTGQKVSYDFIERLLGATDALVMVDEAYFEFSHETVRPLLATNENLLILRTFSKAFSLAGVRVGYILANEPVVKEFLKVRQPYSVDAVSQAVAKVVYKHRASFERGIQDIIYERARVEEKLACLPGVQAFPSDANFILIRLDRAGEAWDYLFSRDVLVRDLSDVARLENCLRVTIGTREQNDAFLRTLRDFIMAKGA